MKPPMKSVLVRLEDWEHAHALYVGLQRHEIRLNPGNAAHYDPARMEDNLHASRASACVEAAAAKYLQRYWGGHYWPVKDHAKYKDLPDVEPYYEVRRVRESGNPVAIRHRDAVANRTIVAGWADPDTGFQDVWLVGEIHALEGWERGYESSYDPSGTRLLPLGLLDLYGERRAEQLAG